MPNVIIDQEQWNKLFQVGAPLAPVIRLVPSLSVARTTKLFKGGRTDVILEFEITSAFLTALDQVLARATVDQTPEVMEFLVTVLSMADPSLCQVTAEGTVIPLDYLAVGLHSLPLATGVRAAMFAKRTSLTGGQTKVCLQWLDRKLAKARFV